MAGGKCLIGVRMKSRYGSNGLLAQGTSLRTDLLAGLFHTVLIPLESCKNQQGVHFYGLKIPNPA
jgi:hypothetical protein